MPNAMESPGASRRADVGSPYRQSPAPPNRSFPACGQATEYSMASLLYLLISSPLSPVPHAHASERRQPASCKTGSSRVLSEYTAFLNLPFANASTG